MPRPTTWSAEHQTTGNVVAFRAHTDAWIDAPVGRVYAIYDYLSAYSATDVFLSAHAHPRCRVRLPAHIRRVAAYLNLIEPWPW